jgi:hypothetical protein
LLNFKTFGLISFLFILNLKAGFLLCRETRLSFTVSFFPT